MNHSMALVASLAAITGFSMITAATLANASRGPFELAGTGTGLVVCTNSVSFEGTISINAVQADDGTVSGTITVNDPDTPAVTNAVIDDGKISNNHFKLISNNPISEGLVPFCHGGDDPQIIEVKGTGGEDVHVKFISTCIGAGEEDVECVTSEATLSVDITISPA